MRIIVSGAVHAFCRKPYYTFAMIEHVTIPVRDYQISKDFYTAALEPLGYKLNMEFPGEAAGFMEGGHTSFWIAKKERVEAKK